MRKSINFIVGLFFFVFVFSFFSLESKAADLTYNSDTKVHQLVDRNIAIARYTDIPVSFTQLEDLPLGFYYRINLKGTFVVSLNRNNVSLGSMYSTLNIGDLHISLVNSTVSQAGYIITFNIDQEFIYNPVDDIELTLDNVFTYSSSSGATDITFTYALNVDIDSMSLIETGGNQYMEGYESGYDDGFAIGKNSGYSEGFDDGYSEGEDAGYESGFVAGQGSVNTDNYYSSGYNDGRTAGYGAGYSSGYEAGYQAAMDKISSEGGSTDEYPLLLKSLSGASSSKTHSLIYNSPEDLSYNITTLNLSSLVNFKPDHIYNFTSDNSTGTTVTVTRNNSSLNYYELILVCAGNEYVIYSYVSNISTYLVNYNIYIPGNMLSSTVTLKVKVYGAYATSESKAGSVYLSGTLGMKIFDYGPISNTDSNIQQSTTQIIDSIDNQTNEINTSIETQTESIINGLNNVSDNITNGYDDSIAESTSSVFADNATSYEQAEANIFTSAKSDLNNFQFYDIGSDSTVLVGLSFVASTMTSIFNSMGGLNGGAGIVLSVLFSVILVSIVIGTYRYFVSSGKTGSSGSKKGGKG